VTGLEVVVGFLVAWVVRKARRVGGQADAIVDEALDAGMNRLHKVVTAKLGTDPALELLEFEAAESGEVGTRTQARVRMSLEEAVESDPSFARELAAAVREAQVASGQTVAGDHGVAISGGVHGSGSGVTIGGVTGGSVTLPFRPERT
jgi:hypothetical protein